MKLAPPIATYAPTLHPDPNFETVQVRPAVALKLGEYLNQNPSLLISGALTRPGQITNFQFGAPLTLGSNLRFRPVSPSPFPIAGSSITKAAEVVSLLDAFRGPVEELAKTHPGLDTPLDILGLVAATPQAWNAMTKPGSANKVDVYLAGAQAGVWLAKIVADFAPCFQPAKPVLVWTGVILKTGDQIRAIIHKPEQTGNFSLRK